jgi:hypothetical protein
VVNERTNYNKLLTGWTYRKRLFNMYVLTEKIWVEDKKKVLVCDNCVQKYKTDVFFLTKANQIKHFLFDTVRI